MKTSWWLVSLIVVITAWVAGCARETASNPPQEPTPAASIAEGRQSEQAGTPSQDRALQPQSGQTPLLATAKPDPSLPVPNLIPPTSSAVRVPQSTVGRTDPFATILVSPTVTFKPASTGSTSSATNSTTAPSVAAAPAPTLPALPTLPTAPITQFPPVSVPNLPPPRPLSETVEISGVVEVGGKTSVIIKSPDERSSRYVHVGDYLGNGNVLVKRVEMGIEPVVVLEENGAEVTRYIGSGSSLAGLL